MSLKMNSPNQSLTNGDLLTSPAGNSNLNLNQSNLKNATMNGRPLKLRRVNHTDEVVFGFTSLLRNESMTDVTLICNGGQTIRAHRVILSTFSPYFRAIFESQPFSNNPCQYPVIVIKDLELSELRTIIDFIYKGEVSVSRDKLQSVLQAAKALEVSGLADLKLESFGVNNANSNPNINTLLANSLMNSPSNLNNNNNNSSQNNNDLDQLNFGSLSALNYVCNLNNKRTTNLNSSLDSADLFNENPLKKLRVSIDDSSELLNSLGTSLLGDNSVNIDGVRSLLQQPPRLPQAIQQLKQQAQINQFQQHINKQRQMQVMQQRQQLQRQIQQQQQNQQRFEQIRQLQLNKSKQMYSAPKSNTLQGQQLVQFQEKIKQQIQEKQAQQKAVENGNATNGNNKSNDDKNKDQDEPEIIEHLEVNCENGEEINGDDKGNENGEHNDDENNNEINKLDDEDSKKDGDDKNEEDLENGDNSYVDYDENGDAQQLNQDDEEEYEIDINKDLVYQRQQQIRLEQIQKQAHFQTFNLMQVDDPENRNLENLQQQLLQAAGLRNGTNGELNNNASRRNSSKDSLQTIQTSSASGSEDTDNDNNNDNTLDINDNLSIMDNNFFDDYSNLASKSPIPMQVKLDPQLNRIPQTPDFLLPRGPGRPRKGNKGSDISPCPECHKKFVRPDVLKLHYRSVHLHERHPCNMCTKVFKWPGDLSKHKRKSCRGNRELAINSQ